MSLHYPIIARIDTAAIRHNCGIIKNLLPAECRFGSVVKCNAYGHGIDIVLPVLQSEDVQMLCVATLKEACELRKLGWNGLLLLLMPELGIYEGEDKQDVARLIVEKDIRITCVSTADLDALEEASRSLNKPAYAHLMLDTGMSRMGLFEEELMELVADIGNRDNIIIEGLYTHFTASHAADKSSALGQIRRFRAFQDRLEDMGVNIPIIHTANTGAVLDLPGSCFSMVRPGIALYGYFSDDGLQNRPDLRPAMRLVSFLTLVKKIPAGSSVGYGGTYKAGRDMTIGLVPIGYGDGYDRRLSNSGTMTLGGHKVPVIGRISMDQTIVDLSEPIANGIDVRPGTEITVIDNKREAVNSVESIAKQIDTVPYEVVTHLGDRILRVAV